MPNKASPEDGKPFGEAIHATAVAISGRALLILGASGSGKSRLAHALIAASTARRQIRLVGDDRILLSIGAKGVMARPHPRIAGFIERRGLGILASPFVPAAPVGGLVVLGPTTSPIDLLQNFPCLRCVSPCEINVEAVLLWWRGASTTPSTKSP